MGTTTLNTLPYPEASDTPYVHLDLKELAEAVAALLYVECTSTARPAHRTGRRIYETNTGCTYISNGTAWQYVSGSPILTDAGAGGGNLTTDFTAGIDPASITIPAGHGGKWRVDAETILTVSAASAVVLTSELIRVGTGRIGEHILEWSPAGGISSKSVPFTRVVDLPAGAALQIRSGTNIVGGTQSFGPQSLTAERVG